MLTIVKPLQTQRLLAEDRGFETPPSLNLKVVQRPAVRAKSVWYSGGDVDECAGRYFAGIVVHFDHAAAIEGNVTMLCALRIRG